MIVSICGRGYRGRCADLILELNQRGSACVSQATAEGFTAVGVRGHDYSLLAAVEQVGPTSQAEGGQSAGMNRSEPGRFYTGAVWTITPASPAAADCLELIQRHRVYSSEHSVNREDDHVLDVSDLVESGVHFFSLRDAEGLLLAIGALKRLSLVHAELKSMHAISEARGQGIGRALLDGLLDEARQRGFERVSLETGTQDGFAAARRLYVRAGFVECPPFGDYRATPNNVYFTRGTNI